MKRVLLVLPLIGKMVSRHGSAYNYLPASVEAFYTRHAFEKLLGEVGFGRVRSFDYTGGIATSFVGKSPINSALSPDR